MKNKRNYLKKLNIVGVTLAFREGELIRHCLDFLVENCDKVIVLLDNHDTATEKIVKEYEELHGVIVKYSGISRDLANKTGALKRRLKFIQPLLRDTMLEEIRNVCHKLKYEIDILVWPDADETFTDELPSLLENFWNSNKKVIFLRPITVYDGFTNVRKKTLVPHGRIYKYNKSMTAIPWQCRCLYNPFKPKDIMRINGVLVHLPLLSKESRDFRIEYKGREGSGKDVMWCLGKDIRRMTAVDVNNFIKNNKAITIKEYEKRLPN